MSTHITAIESNSTGWTYTTDINAAHYFDVYDDQGELLLSGQTGGTFDITTTATTPPRVWVDYYRDYLTPHLLGSLTGSNTLVLQWVNTGAQAYLVERYESGAWSEVARVSGGDMYLQYQSTEIPEPPPDTQWRVMPVADEPILSDDSGASGVPVEFQIIHVGLPPVPDVIVTLADATITVAARTVDDLGGGFDGL